jgi:hypothetical protein
MVTVNPESSNGQVTSNSTGKVLYVHMMKSVPILELHNRCCWRLRRQCAQAGGRKFVR